MDLVRVPAAAGQDAPWQRRLEALEADAVYPLGADTFRLDHGADYFAFFRRLGEVHAWAALDEGRMAALGCGVLRRMPLRGGGARTVWYLCDLKVHPDYRGRRLPLWMLRRLFLRHYVRCGRAYGISMDPPAGRNRIVRLVAHFPLARRSFAGRLLLYSLDAAQMRAAAPAVARLRGEVTYRSLRGVKDLTLGSTGAPMPLWHAQFGPLAQHGEPAPLEGGVHMLCHPEGDALGEALGALGLSPSASASRLQHRAADLDWSAVLTSDI